MCPPFGHPDLCLGCNRIAGVEGPRQAEGARESCRSEGSRPAGECRPTGEPGCTTYGDLATGRPAEVWRGPQRWVDPCSLYSFVDCAASPGWVRHAVVMGRIGEAPACLMSRWTRDDCCSVSEKLTSSGLPDNQPEFTRLHPTIYVNMTMMDPYKMGTRGGSEPPFGTDDRLLID